MLPQDVSTAELITKRENDVAPHPFATWVCDALEVAYDHVRGCLRKTASQKTIVRHQGSKSEVSGGVVGVTILPTGRST